MFGKPRCPIDSHRKAWIDARFAWLIEGLGLERLRAAKVLLPTREFFPEVFEEEWDAGSVGRRVAGFLGVSPDEFDVLVHEDSFDWREREGEPFSHVLGWHYALADGRASVHVPESIAADPERLVAVLGLELGRHTLLRAGLQDADRDAVALTTELHSVLQGFGVFSANAQVRETHRLERAEARWHASRMDALDPTDYAYALALFAWLRRESRPAWLSALRSDVQIPCRASLKYLHKTGDAILQPDGAGRRPEELSDWQFEECLTKGSATDRIAAMWHAQKCGEASEAVRAAVFAAVEHENRWGRSEALWTIRALAFDPERAVPAVLDALVDVSREVRVAAASTVTAVTQDPAILRRELLPLLDGEDYPVVQAAALALAEMGADAAEYTPELIGVLGRALETMDDAPIAVMLEVLQRVTGDVEQALQDSPLWEDPVQAGILREALEARQERDAAASEGADAG